MKKLIKQSSRYLIYIILGLLFVYGNYLLYMDYHYENNPKFITSKAVVVHSFTDHKVYKNNVVFINYAYVKFDNGKSEKIITDSLYHKGETIEITESFYNIDTAIKHLLCFITLFANIIILIIVFFNSLNFIFSED